MNKLHDLFRRSSSRLSSNGNYVVSGVLAAFYHDSLDINNITHCEITAICLLAKMPTLWQCVINIQWANCLCTHKIIFLMRVTSYTWCRAPVWNSLPTEGIRTRNGYYLRTSCRPWTNASTLHYCSAAAFLLALTDTVLWPASPTTGPS